MEKNKNKKWMKKREKYNINEIKEKVICHRDGP